MARKRERSQLKKRHNEVQAAPQPQLHSIQATAMRYSGPLPHPDQLAGFESIQPGFADRIVKMAESEVTHRHDMDRFALETQRERERFLARWMTTGQWMGAVIGVIMLAVAGYAVHVHETGVACAVVAAMAGILGVFIFSGRKGSSSEEKSES